MRTVRGQGAVRIAGAALAALAFVAAACGKGGGTGAGGGRSSSPGGSKAVVQTAGVGTLGTVLVDARGFTLYHLTGETDSNIMCTGGCAGTWPPLEASGTPAAGAGATGTLATVHRP